MMVALLDGMDSTPIYGHRAKDGNAFVSFGLDYPEIEALEPYIGGMQTPTEYVESKWFDLWDAADRDWIDKLPDEGERSDADVSAPPRVGTLYYSHEDEAVAVEIAHPEDVFNPDYE